MLVGSGDGHEFWEESSSRDILAVFGDVETGKEVKAGEDQEGFFDASGFESGDLLGLREFQKRGKDIILSRPGVVL